MDLFKLFQNPEPKAKPQAPAEGANTRVAEIPKTWVEERHKQPPVAKASIDRDMPAATGANPNAVSKVRINSLHENVGILDANFQNANPLTGKPYSSQYKSHYAEKLAKLPVYSTRKEWIQAVHDNQITMMVAGTGSGKSVLGPIYVMHALKYNGVIAITNPKVDPIIKNAEYAQMNTDTELMKEIGYQHARDKKVNFSLARYVYITDGLLRAQLNSDPDLTKYSCVIVDEVHERNPNIDLLLLHLREICYRQPKFKVVLISATAPIKLFEKYFSEGNLKFSVQQIADRPHYPVEAVYLDKPINMQRNGFVVQKKFMQKTVETVVEKLIETQGDPLISGILVFVPAKKDTITGVELTKEKLAEEVAKGTPKAADVKLYCDWLFGGDDDRRDNEERDSDILTDSFLNKNFNRKVIWATDVAESSITIKGVDIVVDTGLAYGNAYQHATQVNLGGTQYVAKANQQQRRGRVGRLRAGRCYMMFTEEEYNKFLDYPVTKLHMSPFIEEALKFLGMQDYVSHVVDPFAYKHTSRIERGKPGCLSNFVGRLIEPPSETAMRTAMRQLQICGAYTIKDSRGALTERGKGILSMGRASRIDAVSASMLIDAYNLKCLNDAIYVVSLFKGGGLSGYFVGDTEVKLDAEKGKKDPDVEVQAYKDHIKNAFAHKYGDMMSALKMYKQYRAARYGTELIGNEMVRARLDEGNRAAAAAWCKNNYVRERAFDRLEEYIREARAAIQTVINENLDGSVEPPYLYEKMVAHNTHDDNLAMVIARSNANHLVRRVSPHERKYMSMFEPELKLALPENKQPKYYNVTSMLEFLPNDPPPVVLVAKGFVNRGFGNVVDVPNLVPTTVLDVLLSRFKFDFLDGLRKGPPELARPQALAAAPIKLGRHRIRVEQPERRRTRRRINARRIRSPRRSPSRRSPRAQIRAPKTRRRRAPKNPSRKRRRSRNRRPRAKRQSRRRNRKIR